MKTFSPSIALNHTLYAIFGRVNNTVQHTIHADMVSMVFDRWGCKVIIQTISAGLIEGHLSRKGNFTGTVTRNNELKYYRSYRA